MLIKLLQVHVCTCIYNDYYHHYRSLPTQTPPRISVYSLCHVLTVSAQRIRSTHFTIPSHHFTTSSKLDMPRLTPGIINKMDAKSTIQYSIVQYNTIQYNIVQYNTVQYSIVQYNTIQYSTV